MKLVDLIMEDESLHVRRRIHLPQHVSIQPEEEVHLVLDGQRLISSSWEDMMSYLEDFIDDLGPGEYFVTQEDGMVLHKFKIS